MRTGVGAMSDFRLSVCLSATLRYPVQTAKMIVGILHQIDHLAVKNSNDRFSRFDRISDCHGQTERQIINHYSFLRTNRCYEIL